MKIMYMKMKLNIKNIFRLDDLIDNWDIKMIEMEYL